MRPSGRSSATRASPKAAHAPSYRRSNPGVSREQLKRSQRERLIDTMVELSAKGGYQGVSITELCAYAGVSPATFYEQFQSKEDCFLAAYRASGERIFGPLRPLAAESDEWSEAARLALDELLRGLESDPDAGHLLFIEALGGGPAIAEERRRVRSEFERRAAEVLDRTSKDSRTVDIPVMAVIGALRHIVQRHLRTHSEDQLPSLTTDGLRWLASYARASAAECFSTGARALLSGAQLTQPAAAPPAWPERLPPGSHGLPAGVVARSQRKRLIDATAEVMMAKGYANTTVTDIVAQARVSRPVFYRYFADKQDAFLEVQQHPTQHLLDRCSQAYFSADEWPERVWRCFEALIGLIVANPAISHLGLVECYAAGQAAIRRAEEITRSFTIFLQEGYRHNDEARSLPRLCSHAIAGAIFEIIQHHVADGEVATLTARLPQLTYIAIAPFTGAEEAIRLVEGIRARERSGARA